MLVSAYFTRPPTETTMEMPSITSLEAVRRKRQREIDLDRTRNGQIGIAVSFYIPSPSMNYIRDSMEVLKVQYGSVEIEQVVHKGENRWTRKEEVELSGKLLFGKIYELFNDQRVAVRVYDRTIESLRKTLEAEKCALKLDDTPDLSQRS